MEASKGKVLINGVVVAEGPITFTRADPDQHLHDVHDYIPTTQADAADMLKAMEAINISVKAMLSGDMFDAFNISGTWLDLTKIEEKPKEMDLMDKVQAIPSTEREKL